MKMCLSKKRDITNELQKYIANSCLTPSVLRNQGVKNGLGIIKEYCEQMDLETLSKCKDEDSFLGELNAHTDILVGRGFN